MSNEPAIESEALADTAAEAGGEVAGDSPPGSAVTDGDAQAASTSATVRTDHALGGVRISSVLRSIPEWHTLSRADVNSALAGVLLNAGASEREESAMMVWSERPGPRLREMVADAATIVWVGLWAVLGVRLYLGLADLAGAGRLIRDGGLNLISGGGEVAGAVEGVPLVGEGAADGIRDAFLAAGQPVVDFGTDLERLLLIVAGLLGLIVVLIAVVPWLNRYLPWRIGRFQRLNAGAKVIRPAAVAGTIPPSNEQLDRLLASRALHRLEYVELLEFTPDPFGDWISGRLDRLARAELDTVGLHARVGLDSS